jgi:hypothetical protein
MATSGAVFGYELKRFRQEPGLPPLAAQILTDLEVNHNLMTHGARRRDKPIALSNLLIPADALELDLAGLRPEIRNVLLVHYRGKLHYRWLLLSEDRSFGNQLKAQLTADGIPYIEESRFIGYLTASRSTLVMDPETKVIFSFKGPTDHTAGRWTTDKGLTPEETKDYRLISDHIAELYSPKLNKSFFYISEPGSAAYVRGGQANLIRDYEFESLGDLVLLPITAVLQSEFGRELAEMNGARTIEEVREFIDGHVYAAWGRAQAEMIANFGIVMTSAHPQNFVLEARIANGRIVPTGRVGVRDGGNSSLFIPGMKNSSLNTTLIERYNANRSDLTQVLDKNFFVSFGPYNGVTPSVSWVAYDDSLVRNSVVAAAHAFSARFREITGLDPGLYTGRSLLNSPATYIIHSSRRFTPQEIAMIESRSGRHPTTDSGFSAHLARAKGAWTEAGGEDADELTADAMFYANFLSIKARLRTLRKSDPHHRLTDLEIAAILSYSEWAYQAINLAMYKNDWGDPKFKPVLEEMIELIKSGLNKLPPHKGVVYRGRFQAQLEERDTDADAEREYKRIKSSDDPILFSGFGSATLGQSESSRQYRDNRRLVYKIHSHTGRNISLLSTRPEEEEILFFPGTAFTPTNTQIQRHASLGRTFLVEMHETRTERTRSADSKRCEEILFKASAQ